MNPKVGVALLVLVVVLFVMAVACPALRDEGAEARDQARWKDRLESLFLGATPALRLEDLEWEGGGEPPDGCVLQEATLTVSGSCTATAPLGRARVRDVTLRLRQGARLIVQVEPRSERGSGADEAPKPLDGRLTLTPGGPKTVRLTMTSDLAFTCLAGPGAPPCQVAFESQ